MKKTMLLLFLSASIVVTSCGSSATAISNENSSQTNVELSRKNFNIQGKAIGASTNIKILGFGGMSNKALLEKAKREMMENANLNGSKAVIYVTYDQHIGGFFPLYFKKTITASAYIVDFTE